MTGAHVSGPVAVIGTGLLGTSIGLGLRRLGVEVTLADPSPSAQAMARDVGAGRPVAPGDRPALVVVAAPPDVTADVVEAQLAAHPGAVVTDVASVKGHVLSVLEARGVDLARYVGSHPMAGRERSGPVAARSDLFVGRTWVVCPHPGADESALATVRDLAIDLGATPVEMPAEDQDRAVALVSHVPQVAASLVAARLAEGSDRSLALAGQGLRDVTRIAASQPGMWVQILAGNAPAVLDVLRPLAADLDAVIAALAALTEDAEAPGTRLTLAQAIASGNEGHARIPGKHGAAPTQYGLVTVLVDDKPGELARLINEVGQSGINLEDLRLEHSPGAPVGLAELAVLPSRTADLEHELLERGWRLEG